VFRDPVFWLLSPPESTVDAFGRTVLSFCACGFCGCGFGGIVGADDGQVIQSGAAGAVSRVRRWRHLATAGVALAASVLVGGRDAGLNAACRMAAVRYTT